jgi:general secretion pathway protein D
VTKARPALSATLLLLAGVLPAAEPATAPAAVGSAEAQALLEQYARDAALQRDSRAAAGDYHYTLGQQAMAANRLDDAIQAFTRAVDYQPDNAVWRKALNDAKTMANISRDPRSTMRDRLADELLVKQQQLWQDAQRHLAEGEKALVEGRFAEAERSFTLAHTRIETLPYADERKEAELGRAATLITQARTRRAEAERQEATERNKTAVERGEVLRRETMRIERDRIEAMLARAQRARERRDFDEAILLCDQVLKINRAESQAATLRAKCRRERHVYLRQLTADTWEESHKRLSEQIRRELLPQLEILRYSTEWVEIDARRRVHAQGLVDERPAWQQAIENQLSQEITTDFAETDLLEVIAYLQQVSGANIILDPRVAGSNPPTVTMRVEKMRLKHALDFVMKLTTLRYAIRDEAIYISTPEGIQGDSYEKIYDIRDLTHQLRSFPGPEIQLPEPGQAGINVLPPIESREASQASNFIDIVRQVVAPQSWNDQNTITDLNGMMMVRQTGAVHEQIEELLRQLRNQSGTQIHVKVKFLEIENSALEQIGVRWQNFNPGRAGGQPPLTPLPGTAVTTNGTTTTPADIGGYYRDGDTVMAGRINSAQLLPYTTDRSLPAPGINEGLQLSTQYWQISQNFFARAILEAVEKERKGNVLYEPDLTLFSGQQGHIVQLNQQAYISDYNIRQDQADPTVDTVSYGTVLDVYAVASADKKYITMTLRPTQSQIRSWRRFSSVANNSQFPGGDVTDAGTGIGSADLGFGFSIDNPLLVPEMNIQRVQTTVVLPDGGSLVLAGLTDSASARARSGVPFLSHIPFLGRLFTTNGRQETERKALIIVQADLILFDEIEQSL